MGSAVEVEGIDAEIDTPVIVFTCRLKMVVLVMTKLRSLRVMGTRKRRKKTLRKKPKR